MPKGLKKPKKPSKTTLKNKADTLFAQLIREKGYCQLKGLDNITCGGSLQCCHIIGRGNKRLCYDFLNALSCCKGHHVWYTHHPWEWHELTKKHFGKNYEYVNKHREEKVYNVDYQEIIEKLKNLKAT